MLVPTTAARAMIRDERLKARAVRFALVAPLRDGEMKHSWVWFEELCSLPISLSLEIPTFPQLKG